METEGATHPADVMCMTKQHMASGHLSQPVFKLLSARQSQTIGNNPGRQCFTIAVCGGNVCACKRACLLRTWASVRAVMLFVLVAVVVADVLASGHTCTGVSGYLGRKPMSDKQKSDLRALMAKMAKHFPEKRRAQTYITEWLEQTPPPPASCPYKFLSYDYCARDTIRSAPIGDVLERSCRDEDVRQIFVVKRRRVQPPPAQIQQMPLLSYVNFRRGQGVSEQDAVHEWNGAQVEMSRVQR